MKVSREVKTAVLAIVAIALVIFGYNFMKGQNIFDSNRDFYAVYDNVSGLSNSADVTINGLKVGGISDIGFLNKEGKIVVKFSVSNNFKFSDNSIVTLYSDGFIGGKSLKITPDYSGAMARSGDTLPSDVELEFVESLSHRVEPLEEKLEGALGGIDSLVSSLNEVMDQKAKKDLQESLANLNITLQHLNSAAAGVDDLLSKNNNRLDRMIDNMDNTSRNLSQFSDSLAQIQLQPLLHRIDSVLTNVQTVTAGLAAGEGTIGKLLGDDRVYDNLDRATMQLEELIQDIKLNPGRYVDLKFSLFGGKNKKKAYKKPKSVQD